MHQRKDVFVIGHKNPDTDSICSAIAYAGLKNKIAEGNYIPKRAGEINNETKYVLDFFGVESPEFINHVGTQVKDVSIKPTPSISKEISLKNAWIKMRDLQEATMPVVKEDGKLEGIISVKDIATANMDIYETRILALSKTKYSNILDTIDGTMVVGNPEEVVPLEGKILIGAANPDLLENYVEKGDILITGNRFESQLCAIEMNAGCIVVCMGAPVAKTIQKLAKENNCAIISTPHDTYMTARLISQSTPLGYFMRKENLLTFSTEDFISDIRGAMAKIRHRDFPVLDREGNYIGMLSRRSLLEMDNKKIIMVDHNEKTQAVDGIEEAEILEIIDHHRLGTLETTMPVYFRNQPVGCTATIVYHMYRENGVEVDKQTAGLLCSAILSDTLMFRSPTCTPVDQKAAEELAKIAEIDIQDHAEKMFRAGSSLSDKTPEEIFYQDFKKFSANGVNFGVGQISSLDQGELDALRPKIAEYMATADRNDTDMLFFLLTNIIHESSALVFYGENAKELVEAAFGQEAAEDYIQLPGVVSRKKQFVPRILSAVQQ
ncbi:putative manganese-dependent inorganic diphosphatase [Anaerotignum lactatifermentans]|uniref:inorganic diphosphatase n=1 Tax=Anaerotignum lactatifermentans TaxID=160404 RepID=A0ABS2GDR1_9FIRM|nr:putative manganese-dependent inorganic diphosphatase [Anaerotignum lactatifermentans]MBM6830320.1 putative manganese-dependent inorganic diphosphatase [Anaerotignum lactatifermentans]MBM6878845.1 putative manganese-dependent inorganic diphosphatase [Anaerotignum lactatifermentans]MBM6951881.1 putative manganese-dependent inorganic diphosphatase [Anaerotignum lactatifermentans]